MDTKRFDAISKALARPAGRRRVVAGGGGALLGLLGINAARAQDDDLDDSPQTDPGAEGESGVGDDGLCRMAFETTVRLSAEGEASDGDPISGVIVFEVGEEGVINTPRCHFERADGEFFPLTGQATGRSFLLRINLDDETLVAIGAGENRVRDCAGRYGGFTTGPGEGELGDWRATGGDG